MNKILKPVAALLVAAMLTVSATAAVTFTPSVEAKPAPVVATQTVEGLEEPAAAVVYDAEGTAVAGATLTVTPVTEAATIENETTRVALEEAYTELQEAEDITTVAPAIAEAVEAVNAVNGTEHTTADYVVSDVFDVTLDTDNEALVNGEGGYSVSVAFTYEVKSNESLIVMHKDAVNGWTVVAPEKVVIGEGTVTVTFDSLCPVVFLKAATVVVEEPEVTSPVTTTRLPWWVYLIRPVR